MSICEYSTTCAFYGGEAELPVALVEQMREDYCREDYSVCARYRHRQMLDGATPPLDLLPSDFGKLAELLNARDFPQ